MITYDNSDYFKEIRLQSPKNNKGKVACAHIAINKFCQSEEECRNIQGASVNKLVGKTIQGYQIANTKTSLEGGGITNLQLTDKNGTDGRIYTPHRNGFTASVSFFCDGNYDPTSASPVSFGMTTNEELSDPHFIEAQKILESFVFN